MFIKDIFKYQLSKWLVALVLLIVSNWGISSIPVKAQNAQEGDDSYSSSLEEIKVTARKKIEVIQDVPLSISHIDAKQIEDQQVRDLTSLAINMPNVALDDVGTVRGIANFSIRGLGINSSIPSIDPTVGIFIDGVYMGLNVSSLFDTFDLESIEVLRGPQGNLFGRNVSAGAILLNTRKPGDQYEFSFRSSVEGGGEEPNTYLTTSFGGPLSDTLGFRFSVYTNQDKGYFKNLNTGEAFGEQDTLMLRPVVAWNPTENISLVMRYEYQDADGDGPAAQSLVGPDNLRENDIRGRRDTADHPLSSYYYDFNSFDFSIDEEGYRKSETHFFSAKADWDVNFGEGTITNIFGWFDSKGAAAIDLDASPQNLIHATGWFDAYQYSNELRYTGTFFDKLYLTTGLYYYKNSTHYHERRSVLGGTLTDIGNLLASSPPPGSQQHQLQQTTRALIQALLTNIQLPPGVTSDSVIAALENGLITSLDLNGGGDYDLRSLGLFIALDYNITDRMTLIAGTRYTNEKKKARITFVPGQRDITDIVTLTLNPCNIVTGPDCPVDFEDSKTWDDLSPKVGLTYQLLDIANVYGHWARGVRSGGYNVRHVKNNNPDPNISTLGPYDTETVDSFEVGYKSYWKYARLSTAFFYNRINDVQQVISILDPVASTIQAIKNVGDAEAFGFELDGQFALSRNIILLGTLGYIDTEYTQVRFDLNSDGVLNDEDKNLNLPRSPKWTYSLGLLLNAKLGQWGKVGSRINYAYRSKSFLTEDNAGILSEQNIVDAGLKLYSNKGWSLGLYGKNLLDEIRYGGHSFLPAEITLPPLLPTPMGGTFSPLAKGRIYGLELTYNL